MECIIALTQLILVIVFSYTLRCELSKHYSDKILAVSIRTLIMCISAVVFFMLFEKQYQNNVFVLSVFITFSTTLAYVVLNKILPRMKIVNKTVYT